MAWLLQLTPKKPRQNPYASKSKLSLSWQQDTVKETLYQKNYYAKPIDYSIGKLRFSCHFTEQDRTEFLQNRMRTQHEKWPKYAIPYHLPVCPGFILNVPTKELPDTVVIRDKIVTFKMPTESIQKTDFGPDSAGETHPPKHPICGRRPPLLFYEEHLQ